MSRIISHPGEEDYNRCLSMTQTGVRCRKLKGSNVKYCNQHKNNPLINVKTTSAFSDAEKFCIEYPTFDVNEQIVRVNQVEKKPYIQVPFMKQKNYTVVMIDPDRSSSPHGQVEYLHWMVSDLNEKDDDPDTNTVVPYEAPISSKQGNGIHRYIFYLLRHSQKLLPLNLKFDRSSFSLQDFITKYDMFIVERNYFTIL